MEKKIFTRFNYQVAQILQYRKPQHPPCGHNSKFLTRIKPTDLEVSTCNARLAQLILGPSWGTQHKQPSTQQTRKSVLMATVREHMIKLFEQSHLSLPPTHQKHNDRSDPSRKHNFINGTSAKGGIISSDFSAESIIQHGGIRNPHGPTTNRVW